MELESDVAKIYRYSLSVSACLKGTGGGGGKAGSSFGSSWGSRGGLGASQASGFMMYMQQLSYLY